MKLAFIRLNLSQSFRLTKISFKVRRTKVYSGSVWYIIVYESSVKTQNLEYKQKRSQKKMLHKLKTKKCLGNFLFSR